MIKKSFLLSIAAICLFASADVKKAYLDGIADTLNFFSYEKENLRADKYVNLNGYGVEINVKNLSTPEIVKYEILALKLNLKPYLLKEKLLFGIFENQADAKAAAKKIGGVLKNVSPEIKKYNGEKAVQKSLLKKFTPKLGVVLIKEKDKSAKSVKECQIVNKILTPGAFVKNYKGRCDILAKSVKPVPDKVFQKKKEILEKNKNAKISLKGKDFYSLSKIIAKYGVILDDKSLKIGDKIYKEGDRLNDNYTLVAVFKRDGIVIIRNAKNSEKRFVKL